MLEYLIALSVVSQALGGVVGLLRLLCRVAKRTDLGEVPNLEHTRSAQVIRPESADRMQQPISRAN